MIKYGDLDGAKPLNLLYCDLVYGQFFLKVPCVLEKNVHFLIFTFLINIIY